MGHYFSFFLFFLQFVVQRSGVSWLSVSMSALAQMFYIASYCVPRPCTDLFSLLSVGVEWSPDGLEKLAAVCV